jgi:hypothetical protein
VAKANTLDTPFLCLAAPVWRRSTLQGSFRAAFAALRALSWFVDVVHFRADKFSCAQLCKHPELALLGGGNTDCSMQTVACTLILRLDYVPGGEQHEELEFIPRHLNGHFVW